MSKRSEEEYLGLPELCDIRLGEACSGVLDDEAKLACVRI
jgi:hypothetical protein